MRVVNTILAFLLASVLNAQTIKDFSRVDKLVLQIPSSKTQTVDEIASFINARFTNPLDRSRAIYIWITKNIHYDLRNMASTITYRNTDEVIDKVLKTRKGVCTHFAELYSAIANRCGIKTVVVTGYTKQYGKIDKLSHAWCASLINGEWRLIDPTWGSGYITGSKYVHRTNDDYFMVKPEKMIKSHIPFDPLWQFLSNPISNEEFSKNREPHLRKGSFNYKDSIKNYEQSGNIERLKASYRRIRANGVTNPLISEKLQDIQDEIDTHLYNQQVGNYNDAVKFYNEGVRLLNEFIQYRNRLFTPAKQDQEIRQMIEDTETAFKRSKAQLSRIRTAEEQVAQSISQLKDSLQEALQTVSEQKAFVEKYISTSKKMRKTLFYKV